MALSDDGTPAALEGEAEFDTGCAGCLTIVLVICAGFFAVAAFDQTIVAAPAEGSSRYRAISWLLSFRWSGVGIGALLLAAYLGFETIRTARKALDARAVWIDGDTIRFHSALLQRPLPLAELEEVTLKTDHAQSVLWFARKGGRRIKVAMIDPEAAQAFIAAAERARAERTFG